MVTRFFFLLLFSTSAFSQVIPEDISDIAGFIAISTMDTKLVQDAKDAKAEDCDDDPKAPLPPAPLTIVKPESKIKVTVHYSVGLGKSGSEKEFINASKTVDKSILNELIDGTYASYDDRRRAISKACEGSSELEKIALATQLGGRLSQIYDYNRANGGDVPDQYITPEEQWTALKNSESKGVCRDAALTLSQFLISCGLPKDRIGIQSYQTINSSHQVVSVLGSDGKTYTINWGELFAQEQNGLYSPQPSLTNTDLFQHTYDPETGKIIERRRNDLGDILKRVTGGKLDNRPLPDLLLVELSNGGLSGNLFKAETSAGDVMKGFGVNYKGQNHTKEWMMNVGIAFAKNEKETQKSEIEYSNLKQDLIYMQGEVVYSPSFQYKFSDGDSIVLSPVAGVEMDAYMSKNQEGDKNGKGQGSILSSKIGASAEVNGENMSMWGKAVAHLNHITFQYNSEKAGSSEGATIVGQSSYLVGAAYKNEDYSVSTSAEIIISKAETSKHIKIAASDRRNNLEGRIIYSVYDRRDGTRTDFVKIDAGKTWTFEQVGTVKVTLGLQKSLLEDLKGVAMALDASWRPK